MKGNVNYFKKLIIVPLLLIFALGINFGLVSNLLAPKSAHAYTGSNLAFTDPNFANPKSGSYPKKPSGFTESGDQSSLAIKAGVIDVSSTGFNKNKSKYDISANPGASSSNDSNILMINSKNANNSFGYISDKIALASNGYYSISIDVKSTSAIANLYLTSADDSFEPVSISNVNANVWTTCYFYVHTNAVADSEISLELYLGSRDGKTGQGIVYFDNISAQSISSDLYNTELNALAGNTNVKELNLANADLYSQEFNFEEYGEISLDSEKSSSIGDNEVATTGIYNVSDSLVTLADGKTINSPKTDLISSTNYVLGIINHKKANVAYNAQEYTIKAGYTYRFTVMAKLVDVTKGNAWVKVSTTDDKDNVVDKSVTFSSTSRSQTNGYQPINLYVVGDPTKDRTVKLSFGLGEDSIGQMFVSRYSISLVSYTNYSNVSAGSYVDILDLSSDYVTKDDYTLTNGNFTLFKNNSTDLSKTFIGSAPQGWTSSLSSETIDQKYGIVSTNTSDISLNKTKFANLDYIGNVPNEKVTNYALALNNDVAGVQTMTSAKKSLSANTSYSFMVYVQTQLYSGSKNGAYLSLETSDGGLTLANIDNINTNGVWKCYVMKITTSDKSYDVTLKLSLGNPNNSEKTASGYALFDSVAVDYPSFAGLDAVIKEFNLAENTLVYGDTKIKDNMYNSLLYTSNYVSGSKNVVAGVVKTKNATNLTTDNVYNTELKNDGNVLAIISTDDTQYNLTSKMQYTFEGGNYYEVIVPVYTDVRCDNDENNTNFGATVRLDAFDKVFESINTKQSWKDYKFYINCESSASAKFILGLGKTDAETAGSVYFGSPIINKINDETAFNNAIKEAKKVSTKQVLTINDGNKTNTDDNGNTSKVTASTVLITLSSLIFGVAIIIAIVGAIMRKYKGKLKRKVRVKGDNYDRNDTILASVNRRQAIEIRDAEIKPLASQRDTLIAEKEAIETEYKHNLAESRSLKMQGASADKHAVAEVETKLKNANKHLNMLAKQISKLDLKISYLSSEQHLFDITQSIIEKSRSDNYDKTVEANKENKD